VRVWHTEYVLVWRGRISIRI